MSLFIRVNLGFYTHPKTIRLRTVMGDAAFWIPPRIWAYTAEHHPDGDLSDYDAAGLALAIAYIGNATSMLKALLHAQFLDSDPLRVHDWEEYNGYHAAFSRRAKVAADARWKPDLKESNKEKREIEKRVEASIPSSMLQACSPTQDFGLEIPHHLRSEAFIRNWHDWVSFRMTGKKVKDWHGLFAEQLKWLGTFQEPTALSIIGYSRRNGYTGLFQPQAKAQSTKRKGPNI